MPAGADPRVPDPPAPPGWAPPSATPPPPPDWGPTGWGPTGGTARTGPLPMAPMGVGEILDGAFKLYRSNFKPIALVALAFTGPLSILAAVASRGVNGGYGFLQLLSDPSLATDAGTFGNTGQLIVQIGSALILQITGTLMAGVVAKAVASTYLGTQLTAGQAVRAAAPSFLALLAARMLVWMTELVGLLGCCVGAIAVMALWMVTAPAIVVEGLGPIQGMRRSLRLCSARYWPVLGIGVLSGFLTLTLGSSVSGVPTLLATFIGYRWGFPLLAIGNTASAVLVTPLTSIVATLVYFDLRIRQEGFDLQIMAREVGPRGAA